MDGARHAENGSDRGRVLVSNSAVNMITSLHPFDPSAANVVRDMVERGLHDATAVEKIAGVENAWVARVGHLRVIFRRDADALVVTSVVAPN